MITPTKSVHSVANSIRKMMGEANEASAVAASKNALVLQLKKILADGYALYFKAHHFHWNVEGSNFPQYHEFFGKIYEEVFDRLDPIAEQIRTLKAYAPTSLVTLMEMSSIKDSSTTDPQKMLNELQSDNSKFILSLTAGYNLAERAKEIGLSNFIQDLIDKQKKLEWMITSTAKGA